MCGPVHTNCVFKSLHIKNLPVEEPFELGSAQTRSWRTASNGSAGFGYAFQSSAKPLEAVRQDRVWAEPSYRVYPCVFRTRSKCIHKNLNT